MKKKRVLKFVAVLGIICLIAFGLIEGISVFAPNSIPIQSFFGSNSHVQKQEEQYHALLDSLDVLDFKIRNESDSKLILIYRKVQENYRSKLDDIRTRLDGNEPVADEAPEQTVESLSSTILTALAVPIAILVLLIVIVIYLIRKKKPEPILPYESKPSVTKQFDDAIAKANKNQPPQRESISTMLKTLNNTLEQKRQGAQEASSNQPQAIQRERKERPKVFVEDNVMKNTQEFETIQPQPPEGIRQKETESGKIEIITPDTPISANLTEDSPEETFEKEAQINNDVIKLARRGYTSSEIARRLRISQDQVDLIIRMQREE